MSRDERSDDMISKLQAKLMTASEEYQRAKAEVTRLHQISQDVGIDQLRDGTLALQTAIRLERAAFRRYLEAFQAFNTFRMTHKTPEDPSSER